jgi:FkbM family methyltransferase
MSEMDGKVEGAARGEILIAGETFELWFEQGDSYLESRASRDARSAEANTFRNTCKQLIHDLNTDGTTCIDIGANVGITSIVLGSLSRDGQTGTPISRILSFEPEPFTFECLKHNIQVFPKTIDAINCALGARSGRLSFLKTPGSTSASHVVTEAHVTGATNDVVQVQRLDYHVEKLALSHVGFIKIDVEGHEKHVLQGAVSTIEKFNPWIYLEFNSWTLIAYGGINPREFLEFLLDWFHLIYRVNKTTGDLEPIKSKDAALAFLHNNLVFNGCVDDLVLRLR